MSTARHSFLKLALPVVLCVAGIAFPGGTACADTLEDLTANVEQFRTMASKRADAAIQAANAWKASPSRLNQEKYNRALDEMQRSYATLDQIKKAVKDAQQANSSWNMALQTLLGSCDDVVNATAPALNAIGGKISDASTWLFGTTDDVVFGANWKAINEQYNAMHEKYQKIMERKQKLMEKPGNEAEALAIKKEIEDMRVRYESLRKTIRTEQRNVGFGATFFGEEYLGRYIQSITENFDPVNMFMNAFTGNIKLIYDVFRPGMLLEMGGKYLKGKGGNLTPQIHDALVKDVMGMTGSSTSEQVQGSATNWVQGKITDKAQEQMIKQMEKQLGEKIKNLKDPIMNTVRGKLEGEMKDEAMAYISKLPYDKLPGTAAGGVEAAMDGYFKNQAVRQKWMKKLEESTAKEIEKITEINIKGAGKNLSSKLGPIGNINDVFYECLTIYTSSPYLDTVLSAANTLAGKIRARYQEKKIDSYEQTEDEYLNSVWEAEWGSMGKNGKETMADALKKDQDNEAARKGAVDLGKKNDGEEKAQEAQQESREYQSPGDVAAVLAGVAENLEKELNNNSILAADALTTFNSTIQLGEESLKLTESHNNFAFGEKHKVFKEAREAEIASINMGSPNPTFHHIDFPSWDQRHMGSDEWNALPRAQKDALNTQYFAYLAAVKAVNARLAEANARNEAQYAGLDKDYAQYATAVADARAKLGGEAAKWKTEFVKNGSDVFEQVKKVLDKENDVLKQQGSGVFGNIPVASYPELKGVERITDLLKVQGDFIATLSKGNLDFSGLIQAMRDLEKAQQANLSIMENASNNADSEAEKIYAAYANVAEEAQLILDTKGAWGDLYALMSRDDVFMGMIHEEKVITPLEARGKIYNDDMAFKDAVENWKNELGKFATHYDLDSLGEFSAALADYPKAVQEVRRIQEEIGSDAARRNSVLQSGYFILKNNTGNLTSNDEKLLAYLVSQFNSATHDYKAPQITLAVWLRNSKKSAEDVKQLLERLVKPQDLRKAIGIYTNSLEDAFSAADKYGPAIERGYQALAGPFPGFGESGYSLAAYLSEPLLSSNSSLAMKEDRELLEVLKNLEDGINALPPLFARLDAEIQANKQDMITYYKQIIGVGSKDLPEIEKKIDAGDGKEAQRLFTEMQAEFPPLPERLPYIEAAWNANNLGMGKEMEQHQLRMSSVAGRLRVMATEGEGVTDHTAQIQDLYSKFSEAYNAKNESGVVSFLGDDWSAGDGTTLSDMMDNLYRNFNMYDEIKFSLQGLKIEKTRDASKFIVSYDVVIVSRMYAKNLKHEEKSGVREEVAIDRTGKARITRTLSGSFWYVQ